MDLPAWVAELTDPRRAGTRDELADRLTPLSERAIDVSRRLQALLQELNTPFHQDALHGLVDRLKARTTEAIEEVSAEIADSRTQRLDRIRALCDERVAWEAPGPGETGGADAGPGDARGAGAVDRTPEVRRRLETEIEPALARQQAEVVEQITGRTASALREATRLLLARVDELAVAVTDLIHQMLPLAHEGLALAGRISALSGRARQGGRGPIPEAFAAEADKAVRDFDESIARLELEWATLGARSATVRAALRGAEEAAFSQVTGEMTDCVGDLAAAHVKVLNDIEARAMELIEDPTRH